jgi:hypothetical protein
VKYLLIPYKKDTMIKLFLKQNEIFLFLIDDPIFLHMQGIHLIMYLQAILDCHLSSLAIKSSN